MPETPTARAIRMIRQETIDDAIRLLVTMPGQHEAISALKRLRHSYDPADLSNVPTHELYQRAFPNGCDASGGKE